MGTYDYNNHNRSRSIRSKISEITPDRWVELVIALAVVIFAALQYRSSQSTTEQTNQLIAAAKVSAYAATQNVQASRNFSESARGINQGVSNAVDKLNLQAATTQDLVEQTVTQAKATNALAMEAGRSADASDAANKQSATFFAQQNRPWVGLDGDLSIDSNTFENTGYFLRTSYKIKNFGNSPALNVSIWLTEIAEEGAGDIYARTRTEVEKACASSTAIMSAYNYNTGDVSLPSGSKPTTWTFSQFPPFPEKMIISGCIVYRDTGGNLHHTQLCYWAHPGASLKSERSGSCWFQKAD